MTPRTLVLAARSFALATALLAVDATRAGAADKSAFSAPLAWKKLATGANRRFAFAACFDPAKERVLVHAGETNENGAFGFLDDLWEHSTKDDAWTKVATKGPTPARRAYQCAAFDEKRGVMWVLGGVAEDFAPHDDLWRLDTSTMTWEAVTPKGERPGARFSAGLHYDGARDRLVLYSGCKAFFAPDNAWTDVWTFDLAATRWTKHKAAAPARWQAASAYSSEADALVVHGGFDQNSAPSGETWVWTASNDTWKKAGKGFEATEAHGAVWDPIARAMVVFGGTAGGKVGLDQVWSFDLKSRKWSQLAVQGGTPGGRAYHALVWNSKANALWAFGGTQNQFMDEPRANEAWTLRLHQ